MPLLFFAQFHRIDRPISSNNQITQKVGENAEDRGN
jgi:hypothetical protein